MPHQGDYSDADGDTFSILDGNDPQENVLPTHTALVVGYGVRRGVSYWKLKNSWGASSNFNGFMYLRIRGDDNDKLRLITAGCIPILSTDQQPKPATRSSTQHQVQELMVLMEPNVNHTSPII